MQTVSARRELAIVVALAVLGLAVVFLVAFAPWYAPHGPRDAGAPLVHTDPPRPAAPLGR
jgi:hypothetical protein